MQDSFKYTRKSRTVCAPLKLNQENIVILELENEGQCYKFHELPGIHIVI